MAHNPCTPRSLLTRLTSHSRRMRIQLSAASPETGNPRPEPTEPRHPTDTPDEFHDCSKAYITTLRLRDHWTAIEGISHSASCTNRPDVPNEAFRMISRRANGGRGRLQTVDSQHRHNWTDKAGNQEKKEEREFASTGSRCRCIDGECTTSSPQHTTTSLEQKSVGGRRNSQWRRSRNHARAL